ncbi:MAG: cell division protein FtsA [Candidatus Latescibacterota bacterium]|nr:cell division protein FtsA [Candidatus Latescibacterota bacterium]
MSGSPIVVLDIGSSKTLCIVGEAQSDQVKILGSGSSPSTGLRRSSITDMTKVVESIRTAVRDAERSAGLKITGAYVGMSGEGVSAAQHRSTVAILGDSNPIDEDDVQRALTAAEQEAAGTPQTVMHRIVQNYAVDGEPVQNPLWLQGNRLSIETLTVSAADFASTTLERAADEAGIHIAGFLLETLAAAETTLSIDERDMGVGLLDMGAGTSDLALFCGPLRHVVDIPLGGDDITRDLSMVLNISSREAEQLKTQCAVRYDGEEGDDMLSFNMTSGRSNSMTRHQISEIIEARQREIFEYVGKAIEASPHASMMAAGLVLTGGGALMGDVAELAEEVLGLPVRLGVPQDLVAPGVMQDPSYATAIGLLKLAGSEYDDIGRAEAPLPSSSTNGFFSKLSKILSLF